MSDFKAPTGDGLQGTADKVPGAAGVTWDESASDPGEFEHDGGTKMFWNDSSTQTIAGATVWIDESGSEWLEHHLLPVDAEPVSDDTIDAFDKEMKVGRLLDALEAVEVASRAAGLSLCLRWGAIDDTRKTSAALKKRSMELKARDLARVPA